MPHLTKSTPKYRKHRASGQAIVTLNGEVFYLGPHGARAQDTAGTDDARDAGHDRPLASRTGRQEVGP